MPKEYEYAYVVSPAYSGCYALSSPSGVETLSVDSPLIIEPYVICKVSPNPEYTENLGFGTAVVKTVDGEMKSYPISFAYITGDEPDTPVEPDEPEPQYGPEAFEFRGETYYVGVSMDSATPMSTDSFAVTDGDSQSRQVSVCFWRLTGSGYDIVGGLMQAVLTEAFNSTLTLELKPLDGQTNLPEKTYYENGWPCAAEYVFTEDAGGRWEWVVTGEIGGETIKARAYTECIVQRRVTPEETLGSVEEINAWLETLEKDASVLYSVELEAREYTGTIVIPENIGEVEISGIWKDSAPATTLKGGISVSYGSGARIDNINFVGAGKNSEEFAGGEPNYGLYGEGHANYANCTFKNFYHAVHSGFSTVIFGRAAQRLRITM